ncbi:hypothetical protein AJ79_00010 [Helicocarpus griseus UAMH5409]|uniref:Uncharacterized protein n=1 Tax=Helicocarpus griseus UAMH5409 TaxID=1447875 RepID=A0A2B7YED8_9EURO|nr:hypothetical protein AJ79_00010 [Helicocarpus griseus UAMH5409]
MSIDVAIARFLDNNADAKAPRYNPLVTYQKMNTVEALYWHLPQMFWKHLLPLDRVFELDNNIPSDDFDWQGFFKGYAKLDDSVRAFANRKRIFNVNGVIRDEVYAITKEQKNYPGENKRIGVTRDVEHY